MSAVLTYHAVLLAPDPVADLSSGQYAEQRADYRPHVGEHFIRRALDEAEASFGAVHGARLIGENCRLVSSSPQARRTFVGQGVRLRVIGQMIDRGIERS